MVEVGFSAFRRLAITFTNAEVLPIGPWGTDFRDKYYGQIF